MGRATRFGGVVAAAALVLAGNGAAWADGLSADADAMVTQTPHGNSLDTGQALGTTVDYPFSVVITQNKNKPEDDVFTASNPAGVPVAVVSTGDWLDIDEPDSGDVTLTGYGAAGGGTVRVTLPCDDQLIDQTRTMAVALLPTLTQGSLNPASVTLTFNITATAALPGTCLPPEEPTDMPPTVVVGPASGDEGSPITVSATVEDDGVSAVSLAWSVEPGAGVDPGASCSLSPEPEEPATIEGTAAPSATLTCDDDGTWVVTLTATDATGPVSGWADVTVANVAPEATASFGATMAPCGADNAVLTLGISDAGANDTHSATIVWDAGTAAEQAKVVDPATDGLQVTRTLNSGTHTATVVVTDDDGAESAPDTAAVTVAYDTGTGILQPINGTGPRSLFKSTSTIPVKIAIRDCAGAVVSTLAPRISVQEVVSDTPSGVDEAISSTSAADTGTTMRYSDGIYIYNLAARTLLDPTAGYQVAVMVQPGQVVTATFGLKR